MKSLGVLLLIVVRSMRQHLLSTVLTILSAALASGLVMSVFNVADQARIAFRGGALGNYGVLGAKGSELQLVLNTVFHMETSPGNIPWSLYQAVKERPGVSLAIPYALGDNLRGFRIVGTTEEIFTEFQYQKGRTLELARGRPFDPELMEGVVGSFAAQELGLEPGDTFQPYHGMTTLPGQAPHEEEYLVTGVLEPTNTPVDRVIYIPIDGIFRMSGHKLAGGTQVVERGQEEIPDEWKEVSSVIVRVNPFVGNQLKGEARRGNDATFAFPIANVMALFFDKLGWITKVLTYVAYLVVVVTAFSLLASIYNTMNERRREFAILRALGARRRTVFGVIVLEAAGIAAIGSLLGYLVYGAVLGGTAWVVRQQTGVVLDVATYHPIMTQAPIGMVVIGALAGLLPAFKAYSTDVAGTLARI